MSVQNDVNGVMSAEYQGFAGVPNEIEVPRNIPTLASSMVLVELHHHIPPFRKKDKKRTAKVNADAGAKRKAASVTTKYLECEELKAIEKVKADHYEWHIASTIPWLDGGIRGLANMYLQQYMKESSEWEQLFRDKVEEFGEVYAWEASKEQARMGALYDASLYPEWETLRRKFGVEVDYLPLPEKGDFRVDVNNDALEYLQEQYEEKLRERVEKGNVDILKRLLEPLTNLSQRIDYDDDEKPTGFSDTLIPNVEKVLHTLKVANVTNDMMIRNTCDNLERILASVSSDSLRASGTLRLATKQEIDSVIQTLAQL